MAGVVGDLDVGTRHGRLRVCAPNVMVATSEMYMTSTTVVTAGRRCLLIDPALLPGELAALVSDLAGLRLEVEAAVSTHPHWDHVLWTAGLGNAPRYATRKAIDFLEAHRAEAIDEQLAGAGERWYAKWEGDLAGRLTEIPGDQQVPWSGPAALFVTHEGHAVGHSAVFFPELGVLAAADMLSDVEVPGLDWDRPNQLEDYTNGLDLLAALPNVQLVIPGHGRAGDAKSFRDRLAADRGYLAGLVRGDVQDARLSGWPPMQRQHERNVEGYAKTL